MPSGVTPASLLRLTHPYCSVLDAEVGAAEGRMARQRKKVERPKITILPGRGVSETINYLLNDRDELEWLVAVGRNKDGEIFFYDTGGEIIDRGHNGHDEARERAMLRVRLAVEDLGRTGRNGSESRNVYCGV